MLLFHPLLFILRTARGDTGPPETRSLSALFACSAGESLSPLSLCLRAFV